MSVAFPHDPPTYDSGQPGQRDRGPGEDAMTALAVDRTLWNSALRQIERRTNDRRNAEDLLHSAYLRLARFHETHQVECTVGFLTKAAINIRIDDHRRDAFLRDHVLESSLCFDNAEPLQDR